MACQAELVEAILWVKYPLDYQTNRHTQAKGNIVKKNSFLQNSYYSTLKYVSV